MRRERGLRRGPLGHELLLFVIQPGRRVEERVIAGRHRAALNGGCDRRGDRAPLLGVQCRPVGEIQHLARLVGAKQIRRRKFRIPGTAALVGMAIEAGVPEDVGDPRFRRETSGRSGAPLVGCRGARTSGRQYRDADADEKTASNPSTVRDHASTDYRSRRRV